MKGVGSNTTTPAVITSETVDKVKMQDTVYDANVNQKQLKITNEIRMEKVKRNQDTLESIKNEMTDPSKLRALEASIENGASSWLSALPLKKHSFLLDKQSFWDALYIRYSLFFERLPSRCVCGAAFNINHALSCPKGGFISLRHNEVRDFTAELISEVCKDVRIEPVTSLEKNFRLPQMTLGSM